MRNVFYVLVGGILAAFITQGIRQSVSPSTDIELKPLDNLEILYTFVDTTNSEKEEAIIDYNNLEAAGFQIDTLPSINQWIVSKKGRTKIEPGYMITVRAGQDGPSAVYYTDDEWNVIPDSIHVFSKHFNWM